MQKIVGVKLEQDLALKVWDKRPNVQEIISFLIFSEKKSHNYRVSLVIIIETFIKCRYQKFSAQHLIIRFHHNLLPPELIYLFSLKPVDALDLNHYQHPTSLLFFFFSASCGQNLNLSFSERKLSLISMLLINSYDFCGNFHNFLYTMIFRIH